jgi:hypothetical protein
MTATSPLPLRSLPGVVRDGSTLVSQTYTDAQWARFQRGFPRKIGGYRSINKFLTSLPRALHHQPLDALSYIHAGSADRIERFTTDRDYNTSIISNRTPAGLTASTNNLWQFTTGVIAGSAGNKLVAQVAPNLADLANSGAGQLFYGDIYSTTALTAVTGAALPANASVTGGAVYLAPYTFAFGNDGYVMWSPNCSDFTVSGAGNAYVAGQKIVRGLPLRAGGGQSPAGLFWSIDALVRATYVGGTAGFQFDTLAGQSSILSAASVIESDGIYYWLGTDRMLMFNGVVREIPNTYNLDFFYDNLNRTYAQKVFAFKVPRYGEIWWCFPKGTSTEPNHAIILNIRENIWYDTALPGGGRGAGLYAATLGHPLLGGVGTTPFKFWVHEEGRDEIDGPNQQPIPSYFETGEFSLPLSQMQPLNRATQVTMLELDLIQTGEMSVSVKGRVNARGADVESDVVTFAADMQTVPLSAERRQLRFRFESNTLGGDYQMGLPIAHVRPGTGRATA